MDTPSRAGKEMEPHFIGRGQTRATNNGGDGWELSNYGTIKFDPDSV